MIHAAALWHLFVVFEQTEGNRGTVPHYKADEEPWNRFPRLQCALPPWLWTLPGAKMFPQIHRLWANKIWFRLIFTWQWKNKNKKSERRAQRTLERTSPWPQVGLFPSLPRELIMATFILYYIYKGFAFTPPQRNRSLHYHSSRLPSNLWACNEAALCLIPLAFPLTSL